VVAGANRLRQVASVRDIWRVGVEALLWSYARISVIVALDTKYSTDLKSHRLDLAGDRGTAMSPDLAVIEQLERWYAAHCNGEWEHQHGVRIDTLDNPGWSVTIDLAGTSLAEVPFPEIKELASETHWLRCAVREQRFEGHGGPAMLRRILGIFLQWSVGSGLTP
jgi:Immunity protein 53